MQTEPFHVIIHTFSTSLPIIPTPTSHPCHLHLSSGRHPIIHTPTLQMPKPPQSTTPHHICHTRYTQTTVQIPTALSIPSTTLHTSISPSFAPSSPGYADSQASMPLFQSHMLTNSGPKLCIYFPLCGMMHHGLPG